MSSSSGTSAGVLLRTARRRNGLSQRQLAERAGVSQSVVSAYEAGRRQPALPTLQRLIEATGARLQITLEEPAEEPAEPRRPGHVSRLVRERRADLVAVAAAHGARRLRVFGSAARGDDHPDSDVDLLADLPEGMGLFALARLVEELERVLDGIKVDLVPDRDLKPDLREEIEHEAWPL